MAQPDWNVVRRLIIGEEGFVPFPYDDNRRGALRRISRSETSRESWRYVVRSTGGTVTIGYGDIRPGIIDQYWDRDMTEREARTIFETLARSYWRDGVERWLARPLLTGNMGAALTSFAYNAGENALPTEEGPPGYRAPGLLRALNEGRWFDAAEALKVSYLKTPTWDLSERRRREAEVFLDGIERPLDVWGELFVPVLVEE